MLLALGKISLKVFSYFSNVVYAGFKLLPTKHKLVFISRQSSAITLDFQLLSQELVKQDPTIKIVYLTKRIENRHLAFFWFQLIAFPKQFYHLATSQICVVDGYNLFVSILKHKPTLKVIQIWHALGAVKKFGLQVPAHNLTDQLAQSLKLNQGYSQLIVSGEASIPIFSEAFNQPVKQIQIIGLPRIDYLLSSRSANQTKVYARYPQLKKKRVILYAPTFRNQVDHQVVEVIKKLSQLEINLIIKLHPKMTVELNNDLVYTCPEFSTLELLAISDDVITDYSALAWEAALLNKRLWFYVYDYLTYQNNPGLNLDLMEYFPKSTFFDLTDLVQALYNSTYDFTYVTKFLNEYITNQTGNVTKKLANYILKGDN